MNVFLDGLSIPLSTNCRLQLLPTPELQLTNLTWITWYLRWAHLYQQSQRTLHWELAIVYYIFPSSLVPTLNSTWVWSFQLLTEAMKTMFYQTVNTNNFFQEITQVVAAIFVCEKAKWGWQSHWNIYIYIYIYDWHVTPPSVLNVIIDIIRSTDWYDWYFLLISYLACYCMQV